MKLTKKMEKELKERALKLKELYEKPDEEVEKLITGLGKSKRPLNMIQEDETTWILKEVDRTNTKEVENILRKTN